MISEYLRFLARKAHDTEYKFFANFNYRAGTVVIIGYAGGKSISTFRLYNSKYNIIQFEKDPFLEWRIKGMNWIAGKDFQYHLVGLGKVQYAQTLFVTKVLNKRVAHTATLENHAAKPLSSSTDTEARSSVAPPGFAEERPQDSELKAQRPGPDQKTSTTSDDVDQIVVETKLFDNFRLSPDVIIINEEEFDMDVLEGMRGTITKCKPTFMLPNLWPQLFDANEFLEERGYRPYCYDPKKNTLKPLEQKDKCKNAFYVHKQTFETDTVTKL